MVYQAVEINVATLIVMPLFRPSFNCEYVVMLVLRQCVGVSVGRRNVLSFTEVDPNNIELWVYHRITDNFVCIRCLWNVSTITVLSLPILFSLLANVVDGVDADRNWLSNWCLDSYEAVEGELCLVRTKHGAKVVLARIRSIFGPDHHMSYAEMSQGMFSILQ